MRKLTKQEILQLQPTEKEYYLKLWRLYDQAPVLMCEGESQLYIQRAPAYRKYPERLVVITPISFNWAEGNYSDVMDDGSVIVENYMMEIYDI